MRRLLSYFSLFLLLSAGGLVAGAAQAGSTMDFFNPSDWQKSGTQFFFPARGYNLAVGDLGADGISEIVLGTIGGELGKAMIYRGNGSLIREILPYGNKFFGAVNVAIGDINGDGSREIITGAGESGSAHVRIFSGKGEARGSFFAFDKKYDRGVNIVVGDVNGDGKDEIIAGSGYGLKAEVRVFDADGKLLSSFFVDRFGGIAGVKVAAADLGGDGKKEILVFGSYGAIPKIGVYRADGSWIKNILVFEETLKSGLSVIGADVNSDGKEEILAATNFLGNNKLKIISGDEKINQEIVLADGNYQRGFNFGVGDINGDSKKELVVVPQSEVEVTNPGRYVDINLGKQKLFFYDSGFRLGERTISSGKASTPTKVGTFSVLSKHEMAYGGILGQKWGMPYFVGFYTVGGVENGIHALPYINGIKEGAGSLGKAVSHGCVRLADAAAEQLFNWLQIGDTINVHK